MYYDTNLCPHIRESESKCWHCEKPRSIRLSIVSVAALTALALAVIALVL